MEPRFPRTGFSSASGTLLASPISLAITFIFSPASRSIRAADNPAIPAPIINTKSSDFTFIFSLTLKSSEADWFNFGYEQVLGTSLDLAFRCESYEQALECENVALEEIDRLEPIFSSYNPKSELNRWQNTLEQPTQVSDDLYWLLEQSLSWQTVLENHYNPQAQLLTDLWRAAEKSQSMPSQSDLELALTLIGSPAYQLDNKSRTATKLSRSRLSFNAFAKGRIVDLACEKAFRQQAFDAVVNIGGEIRHIGETGIRAIVATAFDNEGESIWLSSQGIATSGVQKRGFEINNKWFPHIFDLKTGWPENNYRSCSVVAGTCAAADVLATGLPKLNESSQTRLSKKLQIAYTIASDNHQRLSNPGWDLLRENRGQTL